MQPTQEQVNTLQKHYYELSVKVEKLEETMRKHDFTIRDSSVKIGIAQGLAESTHKKISQLELEINELRAEMKELRESSDQKLDMMNEKLDRQEVMTRENSDMLKQILTKLQ